MNTINKLKAKMKRAALPAAAAVTLTAGTASAAMDITAISTAIATAITDFSAVGVVILGGYAALWGVKEVRSLFRG
ncbi:MAG: hypothetical protein D3923_16470 [Candidatus Electrothrix sp. AR3]|nr:hypothetical protein [Candidatus Electrothrix sp. AR3]